MTDYDKAKRKCKEAFSKESDGIMTRSEERAIDYAFLEAYRYGRMKGMEEATASNFQNGNSCRPVSNPDKSGNSEQLSRKTMKTDINGIIIDGKIYKAEIVFDNNQCEHCDLKDICDSYFCGPGDEYPCSLFAPANRVYFRYSQSLTEKLNKQ